MSEPNDADAFWTQCDDFMCVYVEEDWCEGERYARVTLYDRADAEIHVCGGDGDIDSLIAMLTEAKAQRAALQARIDARQRTRARDRKAPE